jgi:hypothetical protein
VIQAVFRMLFVAAPLALAPLARAADPPPPPDPELLEFLGSEDDDPDLQQYVAHEAPRPGAPKSAPKHGNDSA